MLIFFVFALIKHFICVHVDKETEKWQVLILMMQVQQ
jgi:hypothetical protein